MNPLRCIRLRHVLIVAVMLIATAPGWAGGGGGGGGHGGGGGGGHGGGWGGGGHGGGWGGYGNGGYGYGGYGLGGYGWGGWGGYGWGGYGGWGLSGYGWGYPAYGFAPLYSGYDPAFYPGWGYAYPGYVTATPMSGDPVASLNVKVPAADAEVWFNGQRMQQSGTDRHFQTPPITPGQNYSYEVKARWIEDGKPVERTQKVLVRANQQFNVDLANPPPAPGQIAKVKVVVPAADAQLWLNGQQMKQSGTDREFQTPPITPGQSYSYEVKARWMENGKPIERTETVHLQAGKEASVNLGKPVLAVQK